VKDDSIAGFVVMLEDKLFLSNDLSFIGLDEAVVDELSEWCRLFDACFMDELVYVNVYSLPLQWRNADVAAMDTSFRRSQWVDVHQIMMEMLAGNADELSRLIFNIIRTVIVIHILFVILLDMLIDIGKLFRKLRVQSILIQQTHLWNSYSFSGCIPVGVGSAEYFIP
jgi:hypothetical protein